MTLCVPIYYTVYVYHVLWTDVRTYHMQKFCVKILTIFRKNYDGTTKSRKGGRTVRESVRVCVVIKTIMK